MLPSRLPIVLAPMAGGPTTPDLVVAACEAGALGMAAAANLTAGALDRVLGEIEERTKAPYGVNLFLPSPAGRDPEGVRRYAADLAPETERLGVALGLPEWDDDELDAKVGVVARHRPALVSTTFAAPGPDLVARLRDGPGQPLLAATVAAVEDAEVAARAGVDALVVQGSEAGGHRGVFHDDPVTPDGGGALALDDLFAAVASRTDLPLVAAGGVTDGRRIRALLDAGAAAVQLGTVFLCCPEAGTGATHRRALLDGLFADTTFTRAFTGRTARGLANRMAVEYADRAPAAYPEVHRLTQPLRRAAAEAGDADALHMWAGTGWRSATQEPAAGLVGRLAAEAGLEA